MAIEREVTIKFNLVAGDNAGSKAVEEAIKRQISVTKESFEEQLRGLDDVATAVRNQIGEVQSLTKSMVDAGAAGAAAWRSTQTALGEIEEVLTGVSNASGEVSGQLMGIDEAAESLAAAAVDSFERMQEATEAHTESARQSQEAVEAVSDSLDEAATRATESMDEHVRAYEEAQAAAGELAVEIEKQADAAELAASATSSAGTALEQFIGKTEDLSEATAASITHSEGLRQKIEEIAKSSTSFEEAKDRVNELVLGLQEASEASGIEFDELDRFTAEIDLANLTLAEMIKNQGEVAVTAEDLAAAAEKSRRGLSGMANEGRDVLASLNDIKTAIAGAATASGSIEEMTARMRLLAEETIAAGEALGNNLSAEEAEEVYRSFEATGKEVYEKVAAAGENAGDRQKASLVAVASAFAEAGGSGKAVLKSAADLIKLAPQMEGVGEAVEGVADAFGQFSDTRKTLKDVTDVLGEVAKAGAAAGEQADDLSGAGQRAAKGMAEAGKAAAAAGSLIQTATPYVALISAAVTAGIALWKAFGNSAETAAEKAERALKASRDMANEARKEIDQALTDEAIRRVDEQSGFLTEEAEIDRQEALGGETTDTINQREDLRRRQAEAALRAEINQIALKAQRDLEDQIESAQERRTEAGFELKQLEQEIVDFGDNDQNSARNKRARELRAAVSAAEQEIIRSEQGIRDVSRVRDDARDGVFSSDELESARGAGQFLKPGNEFVADILKADQKAQAERIQAGEEAAKKIIALREEEAEKAQKLRDEEFEKQKTLIEEEDQIKARDAKEEAKEKKEAHKQAVTRMKELERERKRLQSQTNREGTKALDNVDDAEARARAINRAGRDSPLAAADLRRRIRQLDNPRLRGDSRADMIDDILGELRPFLGKDESGVDELQRLRERGNSLSSADVFGTIRDVAEVTEQEKAQMKEQFSIVASQLAAVTEEMQKLAPIVQQLKEASQKAADASADANRSSRG